MGFGKWIDFWERLLNRGRWRMTKGAILAIVSIAGTFGLTWLIIYILLPVDCTPTSHSSLLTPHFSLLTLNSSFRGLGGFTPHFSLLTSHFSLFFLSLLIFFCLAGHTLRREVRDVFIALERGLDEGRKQVARIVGRDTANLSAQEVRTAALETLAENLSDGVVAPLFWLALLGVPGMMAYKMVNTLDSMLGYRTERYRRFGCWAAHIDDIANYIPARITAFLILIVSTKPSPSSPHQPTPSSLPTSHSPLPTPHFSLLTSHFSLLSLLVSRFRFVLRYGPAHASPNSGWPEAALAAVLGCRFGGTHDYFGQAVEKPYIGTNPRELTFDDMLRSNKIAFFAEAIAVILTALALVIHTHCGGLFCAFS